MKTKEIFVKDKYAIAITSIFRIGHQVFLGESDGFSASLHIVDINNFTGA